MTSTIYLDYAATAAIRPPQVADAVASYLRDVGATPGRSSHARALSAGRLALRCRRLLAELFGIRGDAGRIAMQFNATHALNTALHGLLTSGDTVVRTALDHNAVRRPVAALTRLGVRERVLTIDGEGNPDLSELEDMLRGDGRPARLLVLPHASNVTGTILPVREMAERAHSVGALVLVDAAQTAGHHPIDVNDLGVDVLAFTGHKGLLGPHATGGLWVREGVDVAPLLRGGTGGDSAPLEMPDAYPDHLEAGTQNAPGIAGLVAALEWLLDSGVDRLRRREMELRSMLIDRLQRVSGVRICSPTHGNAVGIVTLVMTGWDPGRMANVLEQRFGVQGRAGLHCAPEAHGVIGTLDTGAFRLSIGWDTSAEDIGRAADAIRELSLEELEG